MKNILKITPKSERVKIDYKGMFKGHFNVTYKGVQAIKCPMDYVIYQMIIGEVRPDLIIEIGCNNGGNTIYLADLLKIYDIEGEIHTIDITDNAKENLSSYNNIKLFTDGWEKYDINLTNGFSKILVIEDAAHTYDCTIGAIEKFASLVSKDSYLIIEDGIVDKLGMSEEFSGGPLKAIREFLPNHPEYIVDEKWCDFFGKNATFNVRGYLKRIK